ncbi:MAG: hypothetical protein Q8L20_13490 [Gammaproteobacteria bacterium]|nr:hypothetical protein [Gammaproteobacteria bacterium]
MNIAVTRREPIHGGSSSAIRPPWMAEVQKMQEHFSALAADGHRYVHRQRAPAILCRVDREQSRSYIWDVLCRSLLAGDQCITVFEAARRLYSCTDSGYDLALNFKSMLPLEPTVTVSRQGRKMLLHFLHFRHPWRSDGG